MDNYTIARIKLYSIMKFNEFEHLQKYRLSDDILWTLEKNSDKSSSIQISMCQQLHWYIKTRHWKFKWLKQKFRIAPVLLTYLIGHNNPINGFRPAATHPSRRFCSLRTYASWLHQSMAGLPLFGLSNGCKVVLFADFRRSPHQIPVSLEHPPAYERHGRASAADGY